MIHNLINSKTTQTVDEWFHHIVNGGWHKYQYAGIKAFLIGAIFAGSLVPAKIGRKLPSKTEPFYGMKRIYRLIDNPRITDDKMLAFYLKRLRDYTHKRKEIILAFDWTTLYKKFNLLSISLVTHKGRTIPIAYAGYEIGAFSEFDSQNKIEENLLMQIIEVIPKKCRCIFIADRGFDRPEIPELFIEHKVKFVIRASIGTWIINDDYKFKLSMETIKKGEIKDFGKVTYSQTNPVELRLVSAWDKKMKEPWHLLTNLIYKDLQRILNIYSRRMEIEEMFKSKKNDQCGLNWKHARLETIDRWLHLAFLTTILFQFLFEIAFACGTSYKKLENRYTLCRREQRVFSMYYLAMLILSDYEAFLIELNMKGRIRLKYI